jgi:hypothetical protein
MDPTSSVPFPKFLVLGHATLCFIFVNVSLATINWSWDASNAMKELSRVGGIRVSQITTAIFILFGQFFGTFEIEISGCIAFGNHVGPVTNEHFWTEGQCISGTAFLTAKQTQVESQFYILLNL